MATNKSRNYTLKKAKAPEPIAGKREIPIPTWKDNRIVCARCGRPLSETNFMRRYGEPMDVCRDCIFDGCDNMRPESFQWIFQRYNLPFIRDKWIEIAAKAYFKDPKKFGSKSVIGTYIRTVGMRQFIKYGYGDSELVTKWYSDLYGNPDIANKELWSPITLTDFECAYDANGKRIIDTFQSIPGYAAVKDETKNAVMPVPNHTKESRQQVSNFEERIARENNKKMIEQEVHQQMENRYDWGNDIHDASNYAPQEQQQAPQQFGDMPSPSAPNFSANYVQAKIENSQDPNEQAIKDNLSKEDVVMLATRWGTSYFPSEWLALEEIYERYEHEYELNADRAEVLKKMCKVSLKMDQALDNGETSEYKQLSAVFDQLRKSAKFTEAQKEEKKDTYLDSIGQLVAVLEQQGGPIPAFDYKVETTQDIVDYTLRDMQKYTYSLVKKELGLGELIERYIAQLEESQRTQEELAKAATFEGIDEVERTVNDKYGDDIDDEELSVEDLIERGIEDMDNWE